MLVTISKIAPSEAWQLDYPEIYIILDLEKNTPSTDIGMMINAERQLSGKLDKRYLIQ